MFKPVGLCGLIAGKNQLFFLLQNDFVSFVLGISQSMGLFHFFLVPWFDDERIRHKFPDILDFDSQIVLFVEAFHDLIAAVVARSNDHFCARIFDLFCLHPPVVNPFFGIRHGPGAPARTTAIIVHPVGMHFHIVLAALLDDPAWLFEIAMTESLLTLAAVVAGVVKRRELLMPGFIDLDSSCLDILLQKVMD